LRSGRVQVLRVSDNRIFDNNTNIKTRIMAGNRSYNSVLPLLRSKVVSRTKKIRMYKTIIRPVVLYGSEAWCLTANDGKNE